MRTGICRILGIVGFAVAGVAPLQAQTVEEMLSDARALLARTETEAGIAALRALLTVLPPGAGAVRFDATLDLAVAHFALADRATADRYLASLIRLNPFYEMDESRFNPDVLAWVEIVRAQIPVVALNTVRDTTVNPDRQSLPVDVAVAMPGRVSVHLRPRSGGRASVTADAMIERTASLPVALVVTDTQPIQPGRYDLYAEFTGPRGERAETSLLATVVKVTVDTLPHPPPPSAQDFRTESSRGSLNWSSIAWGAGIGLAAVAATSLIVNDDLQNDTPDSRGLTVGIAVGVGGIIGAVIGRRTVRLDDNIAYNRRLMIDWETDNASVIRHNEAALRLAPLRFHVERPE